MFSRNAALPRWMSGSSSTVWRRIQTPKFQARFTAMVVAPTPPRTPVMAIARPPSTPWVGGVCAAQERDEMARHHVARQRLGQVVGRTKAARHFAVEIDMIDVADHQHADIRLDHIGQVAERGQRLLFAADIDDQHLRRGLFLHRRDGGAHAAAADIQILARSLRSGRRAGLLRNAPR